MVPKRLPDDSDDLKRLLVEAHARADSAENRADSAENRADSAENRADSAENRADSAESQVAAFKARVEVAEAALADLEQQLAAIKRRTFGRRTERVGKDQFSLFGEDADPDAALAAAKAATESKADKPAPKPRGKRGRRRLPAHLPRIEVTADEPGQTTCNGCGGDLKTIGHEVSDRLEYIPGRFIVFACTRAKRACPACPGEGVCIQPAPAFGLDRALPADGLLAKVITDKFADHSVPRRRTQSSFRRRSQSCCTNDEGRPLGIGVQAQVPNHHKLPGSRARVVSVVGNGAARPRQVRPKKTSESEPLMTCREVFTYLPKPGRVIGPGRAQREPAYWLGGGRHEGGVSLGQAFVWNVGTCRLDGKGRVQAGSPCEGACTDARHRGGATRSSDEGVETRWSKGVASFSDKRRSTGDGRSLWA